MTKSPPPAGRWSPRWRGEAAEIVSEAGGLVAEPGNGNSIAEALRPLLSGSVARQVMGARGRRYVREHDDRRTLALDHLKTLETLGKCRVPPEW